MVFSRLASFAAALMIVLVMGWGHAAMAMPENCSHASAAASVSEHSGCGEQEHGRTACPMAGLCLSMSSCAAFLAGGETIAPLAVTSSASLVVTAEAPRRGRAVRPPIEPPRTLA